jgi:DegV family protein with EDD domain
MPCLIDGNLYFENVNLSQRAFYEILCGNAEVSTSQPSLGELLEFWNNILQDHETIVHIPMSSGLSQSYASAANLAKEYGGRVHVVDNRRISTTLKESVDDAIHLREHGSSAEEIKQYLERTGADSSIYIAVDTMKYLKKGGRVTPAAATIGQILKIRPILQIHGGRLDKYALTRNEIKAKETLKSAIAHDLNERFAEYTLNGEMELCVVHSNNTAKAEAFAEELRKAFPHIPVRYCDPLPLSVSCHIGPYALAVTCARVLNTTRA